MACCHGTGAHADAQRRHDLFPYLADDQAPNGYPSTSHNYPRDRDGAAAGPRGAGGASAGPAAERSEALGTYTHNLSGTH